MRLCRFSQPPNLHICIGKIKYGKWKKENTKVARKEYKKSRQNAKRVISSGIEK